MSDNETNEVELNTTEAVEMSVEDLLSEGTDEEVLAALLEFFRERVKITVGYIQDGDVLTHYSIVLECGELQGSSAPERLSVPMTPMKPTNEEPTVQ